MEHERALLSATHADVCDFLVANLRVISRMALSVLMVVVYLPVQITQFFDTLLQASTCHVTYTHRSSSVGKQARPTPVNADADAGAQSMQAPVPLSDAQFESLSAQLATWHQGGLSPSRRAFSVFMIVVARSPNACSDRDMCRCTSSGVCASLTRGAAA